MRKKCILSGCVVAVTLSLIAHADVVVPTTLDASNNGPNTDSGLLLANEEVHHQSIVSGYVLGIAPGDQITAISWRYNNVSLYPYVSWPASDATWSQFDVRLGQPAATTQGMGLNFANNIASSSLVRSGPLTITAGAFSISAGTHAVNPFAMVIPFSVPYTYQGGDLIIDIVHSSTTGLESAAQIDSIGQSNSSMGYGTTVRAIVRSSIISSQAFGYANFPVTKLTIVPGTMPPPNDMCGSAQILKTGEYFNTALATDDGSASCSSSGHDIWYAFTGPSTWGSHAPGSVTFTVTADSFAPVVSVYDGSCAGTPLGCAVNTPLTVPVNAGQTLVVRVAGENGSSGRGVIQASAVPPNATCATAQPVGAGNYDVDLSQVSPLTETLSGLDITSPRSNVLSASQARALWYSYTAPANTANKIELGVGMCSQNEVFSTTIFFNQCGPTVGIFGSIGCGGVPTVTPLYLAANQEIKFATGYDSLLPTQGSLEVNATPVNAWVETEHGSGDAGSLPATAHVVVGDSESSLDRIVCRESAIVLDSVDMYKIRICDPDSFTVTCGDGPVREPVYLFDINGRGVAKGGGSSRASILTGLFVPAPGEYYLARFASTRNTNSGPVDANGQLLWNWAPASSERQPDGPGAANPIANWIGALPTPNEIQVRMVLTGACYIEPSCAADFNHVNGVTVQDIFDFLTAWLAGNASADFNHVNGVTVQDIFDFLTAWLAGC